MKLLEQILGELGADTLKSVTVVPAVCCYIRSVKSITGFSEEEITVTQRGGTIVVEGVNLSVGEYFEGDILIKGDVRGIKIEKP